jgi:hypothetical protein
MMRNGFRYTHQSVSDSILIEYSKLDASNIVIFEV